MESSALKSLIVALNIDQKINVIITLAKPERLILNELCIQMKEKHKCMHYTRRWERYVNHARLLSLLFCNCVCFDLASRPLNVFE